MTFLKFLWATILFLSPLLWTYPWPCCGSSGSSSGSTFRQKHSSSSSNSKLNPHRVPAPPPLTSVMSVSEITSCLAHRHIVFVGDSIMRYQYQTLAYAVLHHAWPNTSSSIESDVNSLTVCFYRKHLLRSLGWNSYFAWTSTSTQALQGYEVCDCARELEIQATKRQQLPKQQLGRGGSSKGGGVVTTPQQRRRAIAQFQRMYENRYFHLPPPENITLTFLFWPGVFPFHGHYDPNKPYPERTLSKKASSSFAWEGNITYVLSSVISQLRPRPTDLVLNRGMWGDLPPAEVYAMHTATARALSGSLRHKIWKTTTPRFNAFLGQPQQQRSRGRRQRSIAEAIAVNLFRSLGWEVFDAFTVVQAFRGKEVREPPFVDDVHLNCHLNQILNQYFLSLLCTPRALPSAPPASRSA